MRYAATGEGRRGSESVCLQILDGADGTVLPMPIGREQVKIFDFCSGAIALKCVHARNRCFVNRGPALSLPHSGEGVAPSAAVETRVYADLRTVVSHWQTSSNSSRTPLRTPPKGLQGLTYVAFAQAVFALLYSHKKVGIIPTRSLAWPCRRFQRGAGGFDSKRKGFAIYAASQNRDWSQVTASLSVCFSH